MPGKHSVTELYLSPLPLFSFVLLLRFLETGSCYVAHVGLKHIILLSVRVTGMEEALLTITMYYNNNHHKQLRAG